MINIGLNHPYHAPSMNTQHSNGVGHTFLGVIVNVIAVTLYFLFYHPPTYVRS